MADLEAEISRQPRGAFSTRERQIGRLVDERFLTRARGQEILKGYAFWITFGVGIAGGLAGIISKFGGH